LSDSKSPDPHGVPREQWPLTPAVHVGLSVWLVFAPSMIAFGPLMILAFAAHELGVRPPALGVLAARLGLAAVFAAGAAASVILARRIWPACRRYHTLPLVLVAFVQWAVVQFGWTQLGVAGDPLELDSGAAFLIDQAKFLFVLAAGILAGYAVLRLAAASRWGLMSDQTHG
jgi:hypothetical protein